MQGGRMQGQKMKTTTRMTYSSPGRMMWHSCRISYGSYILNLCSLVNVYISSLIAQQKTSFNTKAPFTEHEALWETRNNFKVVKLSHLMGVLSAYRAFSIKYLITWYTTRKLDELC